MSKAKFININYLELNPCRIHRYFFETKDKSVILNILLIISITELETIYKDDNIQLVGKYSIITMYNGDEYYIRENVYNKLIEFIKPFRTSV